MSVSAPCRLQGGTLLLSLFLLIHSLPRLSSSQLQNADYSGKVNVKVSEILTKRPNAADRSWPPENSNEFAKININILGQQIDGTTFHNLQPPKSYSNPKKLLRILGGNFNYEWMSIEAPRDRSDPKNLPKTGPEKSLLTQLEHLNFTFKDKAGAHVTLPPQHLKVWKTWLLQQATCPINYFWEDLGQLFWPRWVRRGHCVPTNRCSWPHGMHCGPSHSRNLILLQWKCHKDSAQEKAKREAADRDLGLKKIKIRPRGRRGRAWRKRMKYQRRMKEQRHRWSPRQQYGESRSRDRRDDWPYQRYMSDTTSRRKRNAQPISYKSWQQDRKRKKKKKKKRHWEKMEMRRKRRLRRLIRKLSLELHGYYCQWSKTNYIVNDRCSCMCPS